MLSRRQQTTLALTGVAAVAVACYLGALRGGFVWDDLVLADGSGIGGGDSVATCFRTAFLDHYYRPLVSLSFYLDRLWWPGNPEAYHWVNIVLHALGAVATSLLVCEAIGRRSLGIIAGVLFAVHPAHVGAVAWIGGRTDALGCLWTALFAWTLVGAAGRRSDARAPWLAASVTAYGLAVFTKEQSLFLLPLVPLAFACFRPLRGVSLPGDGWFVLGPFAVVAAFYVAIGAFLGMPAPPPLRVSPLDQVAHFGQSVLGYTELLLVPSQRPMHSLSLYPWARALPWTALAGILCAGAAVGMVAFLMRRDRPSAWFLALAVLGLVPVSNLLPLPFLLFAPYRAAVSAIGACALLARTLGTLRADLPGFRAAPAALACAGAVCWFAIQTLEGIPTFHTEDRLFRTVLSYDPGALVAQYMLARSAGAAGRHSEAAGRISAMLARLYGSRAWRRPTAAHRALARDPAVRARVLQNQGRRADPAEFVAMLYSQLGYATMNAGDARGAVAAFETALGWRPRDPDANYGVAWCYARLGDLVRAETCLRVALAGKPSAGAHQLLAEVCERQGRYDEARLEWLRARDLGAGG